MTYRSALRLALISYIVMSAACVDRNTTAATVTATLAPPLTVGAPAASPTMPVNLPTATSQPIQPTNTPLPTSTFLGDTGYDIPLRDLIFNGSMSGCLLPCWEGLTAGESSSADVQATLERVFGLASDEETNISENVPQGYQSMLHLDDVPNTHTLGYMWNAREGSVSIAVLAWIDSESSALEGLLFHWYTSDIDNYDIQLYPQDVIRELGTPSYAFADVEDAGQSVPVYLLLIYEDGISFLFHGSAQARRTPAGSLTATYCLGKVDAVPSHTRLGHILISSSFSNLEELTPLETIWIQDWIAALRPINRVWGITIEALTLMAQTEETPCLQAEFP